MKKDCFWISDAVFLYHENLLNKTTKFEIEDHLKICKQCNLFYDDFQRDDEYTERYDRFKTQRALKNIKEYLMNLLIWR